MNIFIIFITSIIFNLPSLSTSCPHLLQAFTSISNLPLNHPTLLLPCSNITSLSLPSLNLTGTISWSLLANLSSLRSLDLSNNSLLGSLPSSLFSSPQLAHLNLAHNRLGGPLRFPHKHSHLRHLNLSRNRFTSADNISALRTSLKSLDLSHNKLAHVPSGLPDLRVLEYLDVSWNSMSGNFPSDFPDMEEDVDRLRFLNVSCNNLTGKLNSSLTAKFGTSAFVNSGLLLSESDDDNKNHNDDTVYTPHGRRYKLALLVGVAGTAGLVAFAIICGALVVVAMSRRRRRKARGAAGTRWREEEKGVKEAEEVDQWVAEARWGAAVVVFEKPLLELTFADLAAATSGFGREAQMAAEGGRSGAMYRATLSAAGDLEVVVRVVERAAGMDDTDEEAAMREVGGLRHPNLLPLVGYCIAGKQKLLLYEYMKRGDLHQWLHELPAGHPDDDWGGDTWESRQISTEIVNGSEISRTRDWPTRHRVAVGIARGLAFLSERGIVHGHLAPSNILLGDDLEARVGDFAMGADGETAESNVYSYGVLVMELVTGRRRWVAEEVEKVRKLVRDGKGASVVDGRMRVEEGSQVEREVVECLYVGYLCTAPVLEKRPTMQQVVGLVKHIRSSTTTASSSLSYM